MSAGVEPMNVALDSTMEGALDGRTVIVERIGGGMQRALMALGLLALLISCSEPTTAPEAGAPQEVDLAKLRKAPPGLCQTDRTYPEAALEGIANARTHACGVGTIVIAEGDAQTVVVAQVAGAPLVARVVDTQGGGVANVPVTWSVTMGGGQLTDVSTVSDAEGFVRASFTADTVAGVVEITAALTAQTSVAHFKAQVVPDVRHGLRKVSGDLQIFALNDTSVPFVARAVDRFGNPTPGAEIAWRTGWEHGGIRVTLSADRDTADHEGLVQATVLATGDLPYGTKLWVDTVITTWPTPPYFPLFTGWAATERGAVVVGSPLGYAYANPSEICAGVVITPNPQVRARSRVGADETGVPISVRASTPGVTVAGTLSKTSYAGTTTFDSLIVSGTMGDVITLVYEAPDHAPDSARHLLLGGAATAVRIVPLDPTHDRVVWAQHIFVKRVRVTDASGNGVRCVPVRFQQSGRDTTILTNPAGEASVLMYASSGTLTASSEGLEGSPISFTVEIYDPCPFPYCYPVLGSVTRTGELRVSRADTSHAVRWVPVIRAIANGSVDTPEVRHHHVTRIGVRDR